RLARACPEGVRQMLSVRALRERAVAVGNGVTNAKSRSRSPLSAAESLSYREHTASGRSSAPSRRENLLKHLFSDRVSRIRLAYPGLPRGTRCPALERAGVAPGRSCATHVAGKRSGRRGPHDSKPCHRAIG